MKVGNFTLQIIHAETREPMKEFEAPDGKVYVEAEPDLEYFLRCSSDRAPASSQTYAQLYVDGTFLGYKSRFKNKSNDLGLVKKTGGVTSHVALKFVLKRTRAVAAPGEQTSAPVGKITCKFYEVIKGEGLVEDKDFDHTAKVATESEQADSFCAMSNNGGKKAFASVAGSTVTCAAAAHGGGLGGGFGGGSGGGAQAVAKKEKKPARMKQKYDRGGFLGEVTIHYTSALGFIHLGILPTADAGAGEDRKEGGTAGAGTFGGNDDVQAAAAAAAQAADAAGSAALGGETDEPDRKRVKTEGAAGAARKAGGGEPIDLTFDDSD